MDRRQLLEQTGRYALAVGTVPWWRVLSTAAPTDPRVRALARELRGDVVGRDAVSYDVAGALAPVDEGGAERLLHSLRGAPLLAGARGRPPLDVSAAARAVAAVSRAAAACPAVTELEVNPLLVLPEGVVGLDARVVLGP